MSHLKTFLRIRALGQYQELPIDSDRFESLKISRSILVAALSREEIYEVFMTNYCAIEKLFLTEPISTMLQRRLGYSDFNEVRLAMNVAFVNVLTAARLYVDQISSKTQACDPSHPDLKESIKNLLRSEYDKSKGYRFMEAFRNYVQHSGLPVASVSYGWHRNKEDEDEHMEFYMQVKASRESLLECSRFKKVALEGFPPEIDLISAIREYVEALSRVQESARAFTEVRVANARKEISEAIEAYEIAYGSKPVGLASIKANDGEWIDVVPLLLDWDDIRIQLEKRNQPLENLSKRYVSGRIHF